MLVWYPIGVLWCVCLMNHCQIYEYKLSTTEILKYVSEILNSTNCGKKVEKSKKSTNQNTSRRHIVMYQVCQIFDYCWSVSHSATSKLLQCIIWVNFLYFYVLSCANYEFESTTLWKICIFLVLSHTLSYIVWYRILVTLLLMVPVELLEERILSYTDFGNIFLYKIGTIMASSVGMKATPPIPELDHYKHLIEKD